MTVRRLRQDLDHLTSWALLVGTAATIITGLVVHLWDLHGFTYHTYAGYAMTVLVIVHLAVNWRRLLGYSRFRVKQGMRSVRAETVPPRRRATRPAASAGVLARRGLFGLALGGAGGWLAGHGLRAAPPIEHGDDLGLIYHRWSQPGTIDALGSLANLGRQPARYKTYPDAPRVRLPVPELTGGLPTEQAISERRSIRAYSAEAMTADELARVLLLTTGLSADRWGDQLRNYPSSGALYPIEVYPVVHRVDGIPPGVYHYGVAGHELEQLRAGDHRRHVVEHGLSQDFLGECAVVVYLTMIFQRMRFKYAERSYRYGLIEAGHLGQNLYLGATSLGLGACAVGAYDDRAINELLGIDGVEEVSVYLLSLGHR